MPDSDVDPEIVQIERTCCRKINKIYVALDNIALMYHSEGIESSGDLEIELDTEAEVEVYGKLMKQKHPDVPIRFRASTGPSALQQ